MNSLLIFVVLLLIAVAFWQLTKIFDLSQVGTKKDDGDVATDHDNNVNGYLMFGFLAFIYIFTVVNIVMYGDFPILSDSASAHGNQVDTLMWISLILIFFVQTVTQALLHYFAFKYRGRQGQIATYFADSNKLEMIWTIIPAITLFVLILYGLYQWTEIMFVDENEDAIVIEVYAKQFGWEARYAGEDNVLGKANVRYIEGINTLGVDAADPNAQDDIPVSELYLPKGKRVIFKFRSQDVLHSAYMPHFRAQMNCVPGMVTQFSFIPTMTTDEMRQTKNMTKKVDRINKIRVEKSKKLVAKGEDALDTYTFDYLLLCNKICGASHYNMQMKITVVEESAFKTWLKDKTTFAEMMKPKEETVESDLIKSPDASVPVDSLTIAQLIK
jgi:cytochrome c oxidase subunit II